jgi:phosphate-selective porin OprO and OprP
MQSVKTIQRAMLASSLLGCISATAGTEAPIETAAVEIPQSSATGLLVGKLAGETAWDRAWSAATLYKNDDDPVIQLFQLTGRLQLQSIYGISRGDSFNTSDFKNSPTPNANDEIVWGNYIEARRARIGFKSKFFKNWKLDSSFNVDTDGKDGPGGGTTFYKSFQEGGLTYAPSDQLNVAIGKKQVRFSRDQEISSTEIVTFERSLLSNTLTPGELTGLWSFGKDIAGHWQYEVGGYSNARVREFAEPDEGGFLGIGKIGYDFAEHLGLDSCVTTFTYMHNTEPGYKDGKVDPNFTFNPSPSFTDSIALTNDLSSGRFGLITELMYGFGYNGTADQGGAKPAVIAQSDLFGITLTPSYFIADGIQAVYRFQLVSAGDPDGIRVPSRYDRVPTGDDERGTTYMAHYLGLNYYIYSHKLKVMTGVEYARMGGGTYDGFTGLAGLRFNF